MSELDTVEREQPLRSAPPERRAWVRYGSSQEVVCHGTSPMSDAGWTATVRDVSAGGVGLLLRHRFRPGTPLFIELKSRDGNLCRVMAARVVHVTAASVEGYPCWLVGCAFAETLGDDELHALL